VLLSLLTYEHPCEEVDIPSHARPTRLATFGRHSLLGLSRGIAALRADYFLKFVIDCLPNAHFLFLLRLGGVDSGHD
jgi:hypothetical protein